MNRLRTFDLRHTVMPFVLAALALRALIPAGFMPGSSEGFAFTAMLCAPQALGKAPALERFELPGDADSHAQPHCDFCVAPLLGTPPVMDGARIPALAAAVRAVSFVAQISTHAPDRAPSARAPPA